MTGFPQSPAVPSPAATRAPAPPTPRRAGPSLDLADPDRRLAPARLSWLEDHAGRALQTLAPPPTGGEVRIRVIADAAMTEAHARFHGQQSTTDVLTFDLSDPAPPGMSGASGAPHPTSDIRHPTSPIPHPLDADILVCYDEAARQARARGHTPEHELLLYIIHGVLHCLGHDDHDPQGAARMHEAEDRTLAAIGVGPVYARSAR